MPYRPADFCLTAVKLYYIDKSNKNNITITVKTYIEDKENTITIKLDTVNKENNKRDDDIEQTIEQAAKPIKKRGRSQPRKHAVLTTTIYITIKKKADFDLALKLC
jgi:hypothetical protein